MARRSPRKSRSKRRSPRKSRSKRRSPRKSRSKRRSPRKSGRKSKRRSPRKSGRRRRKSAPKGGWGDVKCKVKRSPTNDKKDLIKELRAYANCWEKATGTNQDMSLERLRSETVSDLKRHLKHYRSL
jgi:hypothetical protein